MNRTLRLAFILSASAFWPILAVAQEGFSLGVAAGDVTDSSAILWTRSDELANLRLDLARDPDFDPIVRTATIATSADQDGTAKLEVDSLEPNTLYYYRFVNEDHPEQRSRVGRFQTAPTPGSQASFRFLISGDSDTAYAPWWLIEAAREEHADFLLWCGDTIYADLVHPGSPVATDLAGYRAKYGLAHGEPHMQALLADLPIWCAWDDHEVTNDYDGGEPGPDLPREQIRQAYQAFFEYMPIRPQNAADDAFRTYRRFRYGALAEFFLVDGRQYRDADVEADCGGNLDPYGMIIGGGDPDCIARLEAAGRTMLGPQQFDWLTQSLAESTARYKFLINSVPLTSLVVHTYDHWDSYDAERRALLEFVDAAGISGLVSLVTEVHANIYNPDLTRFFRRHRPRYHLSSRLVMPEFIVGPIAAVTFRRAVLSELDRYLPADSPLGMLVGDVGLDAGMDLIGQLNDLAFSETDRFAYLVVDVTPDGPRFTYRGIDPDAQQPAIQTLYSVGPEGPPCTGVSILAIAGLAALAARLATPTHSGRTDVSGRGSTGLSEPS